MTDPVFFPLAGRLDAGSVARLVGAKLADEALATVEITGLASIDAGGEGMLVFADKRAAKHVTGLKAAAILCPESLLPSVPAGIAAIVTQWPQQAFAAVARHAYPNAAFPAPMTGETGVSPRASVAADAQLAKGVIVEDGAVVSPGVSIGAGSIVAPNAVIGPNCQIGRGSYVGPGASIQAALIGDRVIIHAGARIGTDGFGFVPGRTGLEKVPQIGRVVIQDNVEIGANTTIDRGALGDTVIGDGTKIDNLVQIAHNVKIGRCCAIAAHCGISGTVTIGDFVMLGGRVGVGDHLTIGDGAQLAGNSGVMNNVPAGVRWGGFPAQSGKRWLREVSTLRKLAAGNRKEDGDD